MTPRPFFTESPLPWQQQHANAAALVAAAPGLDRPDAVNLLHRVLCPPGCDWGYLVIGKTGSSAILDPLDDDATGHRLTGAGPGAAMAILDTAAPPALSDLWESPSR